MQKASEYNQEMLFNRPLINKIMSIVYREISSLLLPPNSFNVGMSESKAIKKQIYCYWPLNHLIMICTK